MRYVSKPTSLNSQRLKIAPCSEADADGSDAMRFDYVDGRIHLRSDPRLCVGYETNKYETDNRVAITVMQCYSNAFGGFE